MAAYIHVADYKIYFKSEMRRCGENEWKTIRKSCKTFQNIVPIHNIGKKTTGMRARWQDGCIWKFLIHRSGLISLSINWQRFLVVLIDPVSGKRLRIFTDGTVTRLIISVSSALSHTLHIIISMMMLILVPATINSGAYEIIPYFRFQYLHAS